MPQASPKTRNQDGHKTRRVSSWLRGAVASCRRPPIVSTFVVAGAIVSFPHAQERPRFTSGTTVVSVDVIVRDRNTGQVVRDLKASDFEVREDGRPQPIATFAFQEIAAAPAAAGAVDVLAVAEAKVAADARRAAPAAAAGAPAGDTPAPFSSQALAGRRLIVLLFDVSSMQPDDVQRAVDAARKYVQSQMAAADLVAVATVGSTLDVLTDFTSDRARVDVALGTLAYLEGTATELPEGATAMTDEEAAASEAATAAVSELDVFNNDVRLRALKTLAETLAPIEQKKSIVYFSAGMQRSGQDNQVELRAAINAAVRANISIYAIDTRGLQAVVPGGDAREGSGRGVSLFSGRGLAQQFSRLSESQATLASLAADTGGRVYTDTNDFGDAFSRVQRDMSAYYLIGYRSTNTAKDGRFRRIQVRVRQEGLRVEARAGYYAERDFSHTSRGDREAQLDEQLFAAVSATELPVMVTGGYFRVAADRYYVPISVAVPGAAVPVAAGSGKVSLDVLGMVRDEQGRPVGRMRETLQLPAAAAAALDGKQVLYQSGVTLPPGRFAVKVVVRENTQGRLGSFETSLVVPELKAAPLKVSSVLLGTQLQAARGRSGNPLARDGVQLLPSVTHVVARDQRLYFYYEVYEPQAQGGSAPHLRTSLAFYRGKVKVYETPVVERTLIDAPERRAAVFQFEVPPGAISPGLYTCQVNIIDAAAGRFAFPRLTLYVR